MKLVYCAIPLLAYWAAAADLPRSTYRVSTIAGSSQMGDGGLATTAQIGTIQGIAVDRLGNVYLSDTDHHRVRKINPQGILTTFAGTGVAGFSGDGGPAAAAQLNLPYGLAVDFTGALYIADLNNSRIRRIGTDGIMTTFAGSGGQGSSGDGGLATAAQLLIPRNVAVDASGTVFISEFGGHRVRAVSLTGQISTVAGIGVAGFRGDGGPAVDAQLDCPAGLAVDRTGALYIADSQNQRIRKVPPGGQISTVLGGTSGTRLQTPFAVAVDSSGNLFVADSSPVVREYSAAGKWSNFAGTNDPGFSGDGGAPTAAQLLQPLDLAVNSAGNLFIADGPRLREVAGGIIQTIAGDDYLHSVGDGGAATAAILVQPSAVWLDAAGDLLIADPGTQRIRKVAPSGVMGTVAGNGWAAPGPSTGAAASTTLDFPMGVAADSSGNVLIAETYAQRIRQVTADGLIRTVMGTGAAGVGPDGMPPSQTSLRGPRGLCMNHNGTLYVADTANHRILEWPAGGMVETVAGNGSPGSAGDGGAARYAQLQQPYACATDSFGDLFIADAFNHRIRKVDSSGTITTVAGTGVAGFSGDEGDATSATLNMPQGVTADDNGDIFISDTNNHRIRQVTPDGVIHTIAGTGQPAYGGDGGAALDAQFSSPVGIFLDGSGDLYVADSGNHRVRVLTPNGTVEPPPVAAPPPLIVENAASLAAGPVAPGELVSIFGSGLGPQGGAGAVYDSSGLVANQLAGTEVRFDGVPAPLLYAQYGQVNTQVPYTVSGNAGTHMEVFYQGTSTGTADLMVTATVPGVFPTIVQQDGTYNSQSNPAPHGTFLTLYATGDGIEYGPDLAGMPAAIPYPFPVLPVSVTLAGMEAQITYAGAAPGLVGVLQVNALVPGSFVSSGAQPLVLIVGTVQAPAVKVWVQ